MTRGRANLRGLSDGAPMRNLIAMSIFLAVAVIVPLRGADWVTHSGDYQRTAWQQHESKITKDTVKGLQFLWKIRLETKQRSVYSLFGPAIIERVITDRGFKELAYVAGS